MRGGRYQQKSSEDVNTRNAEALFESRAVVDIREVEARTRKEIEEKKEELRQLVGASYRDLIESADSILLMRKSCEAVADNIGRMESGFESLKTSISLSTVSSESDKERKRRESLFGIGSRVKYLVDTPEKIWGCLDEYMYLEGSERYLRAREVHSLLSETAENGENNELFATFPLLRHQWPLVETFRSQISLRSRDRLQEPDLKVGEYAIALAAVGTIDELPSSQVFSLFLETRRMWLRTHLRTANAGREKGMREKAAGKIDKRSNRNAETGIAELLQIGEKVTTIGLPSEDIAGILCRLVHMIQASLCHVGELFLEVSGKMPLLFSTVLTAPPGSQLFGGIPNPEREVRLWKAHREKLETSMMSLSATFITESCISWVRKCAGEMIVEGKVLLQQIKTGKELAEVEQVIRDDLAKQVALVDSLEWLRSAFGGAFESPWDCLCELLLKEPTSLWDVLFENMFVGRMKEVLDSGFQDITIDGLLDGILSSPGNLEGIGKQAENAKFVDIGKYLGGGNLRSLSRTEGVGSVWKSVANDKDSFSSFFNPEVAKLKDRVDEGLRNVLEDSLSFFQGPQSSARTEELASYLQEQCLLHMTTIVHVLDDRLSFLSETMNKTTESLRKSGSNVKNLSEELIQSVGSNGKLINSNADDSLQKLIIVEKALFLGRFSSALGQHSSYLPIILGPPGQWSARLKTASPKGSAWLGNRMTGAGRDQTLTGGSDRWFSKRGKTGNVGNSDHSPKLRDIQRLLRHQSIAAHRMWVLWSTEKLAESISRDLHSDVCLSTSTSLKGWDDTVLKQEDESGVEVDMKLSLPAMPSPYVVSFLFAGCQEIYRIGGHVLDIVVLRFFAWKLCEKVLSMYEGFVSDPSVIDSHVSEKGLLQLLFDLRFLTDLLSGGQDIVLEDVNSEDKVKDALGLGNRNKLSVHSNASIQDRKKWVTTLLSRVLSRLDPIDWATYEPHLWDNERRYYQRCAVLFGSLIQLNRLYTDTVLRLSAHADTNILNMTGTVPRFTYLPISAPIFSVSGGSGSRVSRSFSQNDGEYGLWSGATNGEDGYKYGSSDAPSQSSVAGARPLIKSLMGQVGSRFGEGLKLGQVLLSDGQVERFKDKSAAAISTFGDMLPMQAAGLFSSLTAGANKES